MKSTKLKKPGSKPVSAISVIQKIRERKLKWGLLKPHDAEEAEHPTVAADGPAVCPEGCKNVAVETKQDLSVGMNERGNDENEMQGGDALCHNDWTDDWGNAIGEDLFESVRNSRRQKAVMESQEGENEWQQVEPTDKKPAMEGPAMDDEIRLQDETKKKEESGSEANEGDSSSDGDGDGDGSESEKDHEEHYEEEERRKKFLEDSASQEPLFADFGDEAMKEISRRIKRENVAPSIKSQTVSGLPWWQRGLTSGPNPVWNPQNGIKVSSLSSFRRSDSQTGSGSNHSFVFRYDDSQSTDAGTALADGGTEDQESIVDVVTPLNEGSKRRMSQSEGFRGRPAKRASSGLSMFSQVRKKSRESEAVDLDENDTILPRSISFFNMLKVKVPSGKNTM